MTARPGAGEDSIYDVLRREIVVLRLRPGARLSENELAARFGTSRAPVREALIRLVEDGLIEVRPQRGSFVSRISLRAMERARFIREELEAGIVRHAAERGIPPATQAQLDAIIAAQVSTGGDPEQFTRLDDQFHRGLADSAGLGSVWDVIEREKAQFDRIRYLSLPSGTPVEVLVEQHRAILQAVTGRDPAAADQALRQHLREVLKIGETLAATHGELFAGESKP